MEVYYFTIFISILLGVAYDSKSLGHDTKLTLVFVFFISSLVIFGFRYEVGVDWNNYITVYERSVYYMWNFHTLEFGYKLINMTAYYSGGGIVVVIFLSTLLFLLFTLLAPLKLGINPFYFFSIVAPYHLVMSGMNYTRQAIALAIFCYAFAWIMENNKRKFLFWIFIATLFHTSAIIFTVFAFIDAKKRYLVFPFLIVLPVGIYLVDVIYGQYLIGSMDNAGLILRAGYLLPCVLLILFGLKDIIKNSSKLSFRLAMSVLFSLPSVLLVSILSTTMADRVSYYLIISCTLYLMKYRIISSKGFSGVDILYLNKYTNQILWFTSFVAFLVWSNFSSYVHNYDFDSYFLYW